MDPPGRLAQRPIGITRRQLTGHARQPGADGECFHFLAAGDSGVDESDERPGVRLHRAGDVEQQYQSAETLALTPIVPLDRFAVGTQRALHRAAQVECSRRALGSDEAPARPRGPDQSQTGHHLLGQFQLFRGVLGEVLVAQHLGGREPQIDRFVVGRGSAGVGVVVFVFTGVDGQRDVLLFGFCRIDDRITTLPEDGERPLEHRLVLRARQQCRPARPVDMVPRIDAEHRQRIGEPDHAGDRHSDTGTAQQTGKADGELRRRGDGRACGERLRCGRIHVRMPV